MSRNQAVILSSSSFAGLGSPAHTAIGTILAPLRHPRTSVVAPQPIRTLNSPARRGPMADPAAYAMLNNAYACPYEPPAQDPSWPFASIEFTAWTMSAISGIRTSVSPRPMIATKQQRTILSFAVPSVTRRSKTKASAAREKPATHGNLAW